jgi:hypothetical protein
MSIVVPTHPLFSGWSEVGWLVLPPTHQIWVVPTIYYFNWFASDGSSLSWKVFKIIRSQSVIFIPLRCGGKKIKWHVNTLLLDFHWFLSGFPKNSGWVAHMETDPLSDAGQMHQLTP